MLDLNDVPPLSDGTKPRVHTRPDWVSGGPRAEPSLDDALVAFRQAAAQRGVSLPPEIITDGKIYRCDTTGKNGDGDAAYIFHADGLPAGGFQNWQDGLPWQDWHAAPGRPLTPAESDELRRRAEADRAKRRAEKKARRADTAARARDIWDKADPNPDHPYMARKGIAAHGTRHEDRTNNLIVPMYDEAGTLINLQRIDQVGDKRFLPGGRTTGTRFVIGDPEASETILIGEGFSTVATAHQATGSAAVVAFDAGNLLEVARSLRAKYPAKRLVLLADDDWRKEGNPGLTKATEAARAVGAHLAIPVFGEGRREGDTDFNDLAALRGLDEVRRQIESPQAPQNSPAQPEATVTNVPARSDASPQLVVINLRDPLGTVKGLIARKLTAHGIPTLRRHRSVFYYYRDGAYLEETEEGIRAGLYNYLAECWSRNPKGGLEQVLPDNNVVSKHADALRAAAYLLDSIEAPSWIGEQPTDMPATEMVSLQNGLLHLPSKSLIRHTPAFFTYNALPFNYEPATSTPKQWLAFLNSIWPDDQESIDTLQEIFGLCLTKNTEFQKMFMIIGPPRCGKGTIARILRAMLGTRNVVAPTLSSLSETFGLEQLIGKLVAIISDARITAHTDSDAVVERLLNISGEDAVSVNRKNTSYWNGQLQIRVVMLANGLPRFKDPSGAFANRWIILRIVPSFLGKEDLTLTKKLMPELPEILNWSIAGWERIEERGYFLQPKTAEQDVKQMREMASPIMVFVTQRCAVAGTYQIAKTALYQAWRDWCSGEGREPGNSSTFGRTLKEVLPSLGEERPRQPGSIKRPEYYQGIKLQPEYEPSRNQPYWESDR